MANTNPRGRRASARVSAKGLFALSMLSLAAGPLFLLPMTVHAQGGGLADIQKQLTSLYSPAKATADGTDLVTAGAVLVLQKDNLQMCKVEQPLPVSNYYKNGAITQAGFSGFFKAMNVLSKFGAAGGAAGAAAGSAAGAAPSGETRQFVAGEKFFVTHIATAPDGVTFAFISDPIKDQRYKSTLKFAFPKGAVPSSDDVAAMVGEVIKVDAPEGAEQAPATAAAPAAAPTKTIAVGQSRDEVIAMFGVPSKVVQLGAKEIDFFPDMKVTFVKNKVQNVE
jgi:hypothetical protein